MNKLMKLIIWILTTTLLIGFLLFPILADALLPHELVNSILESVNSSDWKGIIYISPYVLINLVIGLLLSLIFLKSLFGLFGRKRKIKIIGLNITIIIFIGLLFSLKYGLPKIIDKLPPGLPDFFKDFIFAQTILFSHDVHFFTYVIGGYAIVVIILAIMANINVKPYQTYPAAFMPQQPYYPPVCPNQIPVVVCKNCGNQMPAGSLFCGRCGSKI